MPKVEKVYITDNETYLFCQLVQNQAKQKQAEVEWAVVNNKLGSDYASGKVSGIQDVLSIIIDIRLDMERR